MMFKISIGRQEKPILQTAQPLLTMVVEIQRYNNKKYIYMVHVYLCIKCLTQYTCVSCIQYPRQNVFVTCVSLITKSPFVAQISVGIKTNLRSNLVTDLAVDFHIFLFFPPCPKHNCNVSKAHALRVIFAKSQHANSCDNRIDFLEHSITAYDRSVHVVTRLQAVSN